jgi:hypothetical protein
MPASPPGIFTPYPDRAVPEVHEAGLANFPRHLEAWADYNWVEARHSFLSPAR